MEREEDRGSSAKTVVLMWTSEWAPVARVLSLSSPGAPVYIWVAEINGVPVTMVTSDEKPVFSER